MRPPRRPRPPVSLAFNYLPSISISSLFPFLFVLFHSQGALLGQWHPEMQISSSLRTIVQRLREFSLFGRGAIWFEGTEVTPNLSHAPRPKGSLHV